MDDRAEFLGLVKSFLVEVITPNFKTLVPVAEALIKACDDSPDIESVLSHLQALRHFARFSKGKAFYERVVGKDKFNALMKRGQVYVIPQKKDEENSVHLESGTIITRQDDILREQKLNEEQIRLAENIEFKSTLIAVWCRAIKKKHVSKKIFISYAWPIRNEDNEAWVQPFLKKMAKHLVLMGFQVYLDETHGGPGYSLEKFMDKIKMSDHILLISSRTMAKKIENPLSGVYQERYRIIQSLRDQPDFVKKRKLIPVLLNYQKYISDEAFASIAEIPLCVEGYLGGLMKLVPRVYRDSLMAFEKWFDTQLKRKQVVMFEGFPHLPPASKRFERKELLEEVESKLQLESLIAMCGQQGTGKTEAAITFCYSAVAKRRYHKMFWFENDVQELPPIPEGSLIVLNNFENCAERLGDLLQSLVNVDRLITTREPLSEMGIPCVEVFDFTHDEAVKYVQKCLWNIHAHNVEHILDFIRHAGLNPRALSGALEKLNQSHLNIPRYLRWVTPTMFSSSVHYPGQGKPRTITEQKYTNTSQLGILEHTEERDREIFLLEVHEPAFNIFSDDKDIPSTDKVSVLFKSSERVKPFHLPIKNPNFTGRKDQLDSLNALLSLESFSQLKPVTIVSCDGLAGAGKTQIAIEIAHRLINHYRLVVWLPADSVEHLQAAYVELAGHVGIEVSAGEPEKTLRKVKEYLTQHTGNLLIFDGVRDYEGFKNLKRFLPETGNAVLITSGVSCPDWCESITIPLFSKEDAFKYVVRILKEKKHYEHGQEVNLLCETVGYLPLALSTAVAYIAVQNITIQEFLRRFREAPVPVLNSSLRLIFETNKSVYVTFELAMEKLESEMPLAREVLEMCSFLHRDRIPGFLFAILGIEKALRVLHQYSLITIDMHYKIAIHPLLQDVIQARLNSVTSEERADAILKLLFKAFAHTKCDELDYFRIARLLLPHMRVLRRHLKNDPKKLKALLEYLVNCQQILGERHDALSTVNELLCLVGLAEGEHSEAFAGVLRNVANQKGVLSDFREQLILLQRALDILESKTPQKKSLIAVVLQDMGMAYERLGEEENCLNVRIRAWSMICDDSTIAEREKLNALTNLAAAYGAAGNYVKGCELGEEALRLSERIHGHLHPTTGLILTNLGLAYHEEGNLKYACELIVRGAEILKAHFGASDPDVLASWTNLVFFLIEKEDFIGAKEKISAIFDVLEKNFGPQHERTLHRLFSHELFHRVLQFFDEVESVFSRLFCIVEKYALQNEKHRQKILLQLEAMCWKLSKTNNREWLGAKGCSVCTYVIRLVEKLDSGKLSSNFCAYIMTTLAYSYGEIEDSEKHIEWLERAWPIIEKEEGARSAVLGEVLMNLGAGYCDRAEEALEGAYVQKALEYLGRAWEILIKHFGVEHSYIKDINENTVWCLSLIHGKDSDQVKIYREAVAELERPVKKQEKLSDPATDEEESVEEAEMTCEQLEEKLVEIDQCSTQKSRELEKVLGLLFQKYSKNREIDKTAKIMDRLLFINDQDKKSERIIILVLNKEDNSLIELAEKYWLPVLEKYYAAGRYRYALALNLRAFGHAYMLAGNFIKAKEFLIKASTLFSELYGKDDFYVADIYLMLYGLSESGNNIEESMNFLRGASNALESSCTVNGNLNKNRLKECREHFADLYSGRSLSAAERVLAIAAQYRQAGNIRRATTFFEMAFYLYKMEEELDYQILGSIYNVLVEAYTQLNDDEKRYRIIKKGAFVCERLYGVKVLEFGNHCVEIGKYAMRLNKWRDAQKFLLMGLSIFEKNNISSSFMIGDILESLTRLSFTLGQERKAAEYNVRAVIVFQECCKAGNFSEELMASYITAANFYSVVKKKYLLAADHYEFILPFVRTYHGEQSREVGNVYLRLGRLYKKGENPDKAKSCFAQALPIFESEVAQIDADKNDDPGELVDVLIDLGEVYGGLDDQQSSKKCLVRALSVQEDELGADNIELVDTLLAICAAYEDNGDFPEASKLLERVITLEEISGGKDSVEVARTRYDLAQFYMSMKLFEKASQAAFQAYEVFLRDPQVGEEHEDTLDAHQLFKKAQRKLIGGNSTEEESGEGSEEEVTSYEDEVRILWTPGALADYVNKHLWNAEIHNPVHIQALINGAENNFRKLEKMVEEINQYKLNIPRYLDASKKEDVFEGVCFCADTENCSAVSGKLSLSRREFLGLSLSKIENVFSFIKFMPGTLSGFRVKPTTRNPDSLLDERLVSECDRVVIDLSLTGGNIKSVIEMEYLTEQKDDKGVVDFLSEEEIIERLSKVEGMLLAKHVLNVCSFFHPDFISGSLLSIQGVAEALIFLESQSLIFLDKHYGVMLRPTVREIVRSRLTEVEEMKYVDLACVLLVKEARKCLYYLEDTNEREVVAEKFILHARELLEFINEDTLKKVKILPTVIELLLILNMTGDSIIALKMLLAAQETLDEVDNKLRAKMLVKLGRMYLAEEEATKACELIEHGLSVEEAEYGKEDRRILKTLVYLADVYEVMENSQKACEIMERAFSLVKSSMLDYKKACELLFRETEALKKQSYVLECNTTVHRFEEGVKVFLKLVGVYFRAKNFARFFELMDWMTDIHEVCSQKNGEIAIHFWFLGKLLFEAGYIEKAKEAVLRARTFVLHNPTCDALEQMPDLGERLEELIQKCRASSQEAFSSAFWEKPPRTSSDCISVEDEDEDEDLKLALELSLQCSPSVTRATK